MKLFLCFLVIVFLIQKIEGAPSHPIEIEVVFLKPNEPLIRMKIEHQTFLQLLDLGADYECGLTDEAMKSLQKELFAKSSYANFKGISREALQFLIPEIHLGALTMKNVIVHGQVAGTLESFYVWDEETYERKPISGIIGNKILERGNLLLDFPNKRIFFVQDLACQQVGEYEMSRWMKMGFEWRPIGILINVETDIGVLKCLLDTGATHNCIYSSQLSEQSRISYQEGIRQLISSKFKLGERDFGEQRLIELKNKITFAGEQGIIGMEFLKNHTFYIDYPNKMLYIKPHS